MKELFAYSNLHWWNSSWRNRSCIAFICCKFFLWM